MIREGFNGFCMALADSVPGVSGGTVAFIMGFYDKFIGSINSLVFGSMKEKKQSAGYLVKLGIGWVIGMALAALVLSNLFESHIYTVSSLFIGFIAGSIPLIVMEEKESFKQVGKGIGFRNPGGSRNRRAERTDRQQFHEPGTVLYRTWYEIILYRNDRYLSYVFAWNLRLDLAFDLRSLYSGDHGGKGITSS